MFNIPAASLILRRVIKFTKFDLSCLVDVTRHVNEQTKSKTIEVTVNVDILLS